MQQSSEKDNLESRARTEDTYKFSSLFMSGVKSFSLGILAESYFAQYPLPDPALKIQYIAAIPLVQTTCSLADRYIMKNKIIGTFQDFSKHQIDRGLLSTTSYLSGVLFAKLLLGQTIK